MRLQLRKAAHHGDLFVQFGQRGRDRVDVRIDQAGQDRATAHVNLLRRRADRTADLLRCSDRTNAISSDRNRFRDWLLRVHRDELRVVEQQVRASSGDFTARRKRLGREGGGNEHQ